MRDEILRLGVVGCGWAGQQAVLAAAAGPRTQVVAVSDLDERLCQQVASESSVPRQYEGYEDLYRDEQVEAVYLAVNPVMRYPMVMDALAAGKHVLVQKPHAVRAAQIREFERAAEGAGRILQFCYFMRHYPHNRQVRAAVQQGRIGEPYHARVFLKCNTLPAAEGITRWLQVYGQKGGALGQHASHEVDLAWWWLGCPRPLWAFAARHCVYPVYDGPEGPAEDYISGLVGLEGGKTLQIDCSRWLHADTPTSVEVYGAEGAISGGKISRFEEGRYLVEEVDLPGDVAHSEPPREGLFFYYELEHFAMAVAGLVEVDVNAKDAYFFMQILDGLYDSARVGEKVAIECALE